MHELMEGVGLPELVLLKDSSMAQEHARHVAAGELVMGIMAKIRKYGMNLRRW